jgi:hypothetical protein
MSDSLDKKYKAHRIHPSAEQSPTSQKWTPACTISWDENGKQQYETLYGPRDKCDTFPQAINYAFQAAMTWIDEKAAAAEKKSA